MRRALVLVAVLCLSGCAAGLDMLRDAASRVSLDDAMACADLPSKEARAKCLGREVATDGIDLALRNVARLGALAMRALAPGGADEFTEAEKRRLARDLDAALAQLAAEIEGAK